MNILLLTIPLALALSAAFLLAFLWAAREGQFDDNVTPAIRILHEGNQEEEKS